MKDDLIERAWGISPMIPNNGLEGKVFTYTGRGFKRWNLPLFFVQTLCPNAVI